MSATETALGSPVSARPASQRRTIRRLLKDPRLLIGGIIVIVMTTVALLAPLSPHHPYTTNAANVLASPDSTYWMGTDELGRDIFSRVVEGARISLRVGIFSVLIALTIGVVIGMVAGYVGRFVDDTLMRLMDMILAFPAIVLALGLMAALGPGLNNAMAAIAFVNIPVFARLIRGQVLTVKHLDYISAAKVIGQRHELIMIRHILPNVSGPLIIQASIAVAFAILYEASLSFLGLGAQPPAPSWGTMLNVGKNYMELAPWLAIFPGLAIFVTVIGFNLLGDGIHDAIDPRTRKAI